MLLAKKTDPRLARLMKSCCESVLMCDGKQGIVSYALQQSTLPSRAGCLKCATHVDTLTVVEMVVAQ